MQLARADDPDVRRNLTVVSGDVVSQKNVVWYGLRISQKAQALAAGLRWRHTTRSRERLLSNLTCEMAEANGFPIPLLQVVAKIPKADLEGVRHRRRVTGIYSANLMVIKVAARLGSRGRCRHWRAVLLTYCHELAHHLDHVYWKTTEHTTAFFDRVTDLYVSLTAVQTVTGRACQGAQRSKGALTARKRIA